MFNCEKLDLKATISLSIKNHKESTHNWCTDGYSTINSQEQLKNHLENVQNGKKKKYDWTHAWVPKIEKVYFLFNISGEIPR